MSALFPLSCYFVFFGSPKIRPCVAQLLLRRGRGSNTIGDVVHSYILQAESMKRKALEAKRSDPGTAMRLSDDQQTLAQIVFLERYAKAFEQKRQYMTANAILIALTDVIIRGSKRMKDVAMKKRINQSLSLIIRRIEETKRLSVGEAVAPPTVKEYKHSELSPGELEVLRKASFINSKTFLPWLESDLHDQFWSKDLFTDPDGLLKLSRSQEEILGGWKRPWEIMKNPHMIYLVSGSVLIQDVVTDCSFVASLCVSAAYERRFRTQLITSCIYPQDENGNPMWNPFGKYVVRLFFNGIQRKVCIVVDDLLPVNKEGKLMCTHSSNKDELWSSIIEKAYMKLMGGYDFLGSNSGVDLHSLTGWIPEHLFINEKEFKPDAEWNRLLQGFNHGEVLITVATGGLSDQTSEDVGLVPGHSYAVLDVREVQGQRLMQLKNPWSHRRWKGAFSHLDEKNWTPSLREAVNFNQLAAFQFDDGIFWINFESVCEFFTSLHLNWNPEKFRFRHALHFGWPSMEVVSTTTPDTFTFGNNPQYGLELDVKDEESSLIWLLLTKHVNRAEENQDFIAIHIFADTDCERVYYPDVYTPVHRGMYINSTHVLASFNGLVGLHRYSLVVSQLGPPKPLSFTLRAYGMSPFLMGPINNSYSFETKVRGSWTDQTAGGSQAHLSFMKNPNFSLSIPPGAREVSLLIMLETDLHDPINIKLFDGIGRIFSVLSRENRFVADSGDYRFKFCFFERKVAPGGAFTLVPSTFGPGVCGSFTMTLRSSCRIGVMPIP
ncbi:hypothetical protein DFJ73DRAFT_843383 [Zopfochytrium polystomum]|nr:hypothetical protein DFJ73DRAFT_843383 [Zopfochytrium polystomum]